LYGVKNTMEWQTFTNFENSFLGRGHLLALPATLRMSTVY
jgi:hypothetical protein